MNRGKHVLPGWLRTAASLPCLLLQLMAATSCVTIYQPQRAIHRPVVVPSSPTNFEGLRVLVRCNSHEKYLPVGDAARLCGRIADDLEQQGAICEWVVPVGANFVEPSGFDGEEADLTLENREQDRPRLRLPVDGRAFCLTCSMIPTMEEYTYSQRVVVFGRDRSVLTEEVFRERFVQYTGLGIWGLNYLIDWLFRSDEDALSGDAGKKAFSRDFYGQIRQILFNARIRSEVLGLTQAPGRAAVIDVDAAAVGAAAADATVKRTPRGDDKPAVTDKPGDAAAPDRAPAPPPPPDALRIDPDEK
jgi:hypothetical protein